MEKRISVLPREIADKIAAGEVIERPASIVKELLENALDAGADEIAIELEEGGKKSIRISDNGAGIDPLDVKVAFERHATSKIRSLDDLYQLHSFGFRGEALPSIAAVSDMEVLTRRRGELCGTRALIEKGDVREITEVGCPEGTVIVVKDIFGAIPVRKKFLKKDAVEQGYCVDTITRVALAHPGVKIKVSAGKRSVLNIPKTGDITEKIAIVLGLDFKEKMLSVTGHRNGIRINGFVSRPEHARASSKATYFYVNRRYVRDHLITHAVMTAYRGRMEPRKYPAAVLYIDVPPGEVDVNVHPAKTEVRFRDSKAVYEAVLESLAAALSEVGRLPGASAPVTYRSLPYRVEEPPGPSYVRFGDAQRREPGFRNPVYEAPFPLSGGTVQEEFRMDSSGQGFFSSLRYIGQAAGTYLIFTTEQELLLIDQHAAHERILFEKLRAASEKDRTVQPLLIPEIVAVSSAESAVLPGFIDLIREAGFDISLLDPGTIVIKSIPSFLRDPDAGAIIKDILSELTEYGKTQNLEEAKERILAMVACKAAVKAHDRIDEKEVARLCRDLDRIPNAATCPHGRPVLIKFPFRDLERMFKRRE